MCIRDSDKLRLVAHCVKQQKMLLARDTAPLYTPEYIAPLYFELYMGSCITPDYTLYTIQPLVYSLTEPSLVLRGHSVQHRATGKVSKQPIFEEAPVIPAIHPSL